MATKDTKRPAVTSIEDYDRLIRQKRAQLLDDEEEGWSYEHLQRLRNELIDFELQKERALRANKKRRTQKKRKSN